MQYIKKIGTELEKRGVDCSQQYINDCWNEDEGCYVNLTYDSSKLVNLRNVLVEEERYCCYCMRKLYLRKDGDHNPNVTLEHIIPHQIKKNEWQDTKDAYQKFEPLCSDKVSVCYNGKYEHTAVKIKALPHPHYISYHNLVASCNGETFCNSKDAFKLVSSNCCNNKRQERFVMPFFLCENVEVLFGYDKDGKLDYDDDYIKEEWFDNMHLNLSSTWLNSVRKFWCQLALSEVYSVDDVEKAITEVELRREILDDIDPGATIFPGSVDYKLWTILSEYCWFYTYYKNKSAE